MCLINAVRVLVRAYCTIAASPSPQWRRPGTMCGCPPGKPLVAEMNDRKRKHLKDELRPGFVVAKLEPELSIDLATTRKSALISGVQ